MRRVEFDTLRFLLGLMLEQSALLFRMTLSGVKIKFEKYLLKKKCIRCGTVAVLMVEFNISKRCAYIYNNMINERLH